MSIAVILRGVPNYQHPIYDITTSMGTLEGGEEENKNEMMTPSAT